MEMVLLAGLVILALIVTATVIGSLVRAALWILFLPFRVVGWLLFLPLLLLKVVVAIVGRRPHARRRGRRGGRWPRSWPGCSCRCSPSSSSPPSSGSSSR